MERGGDRYTRVAERVGLQIDTCREEWVCQTLREWTMEAVPTDRVWSWFTAIRRRAGGSDKQD